ncbi:MAG: amidase family protein [Desulfitobacteriaceae bacterium]
MKESFKIEEATIADMRAWQEDGKLTSKELIQMYLERIAMYDKNGPMINSVLEINPDALDLAEAMDAERKRKGPRGPLHGIPVLLKDNIDTADKMHTSAGSIALQNSIAAEDSFIVKQLRKAGAVILGKANMTEWANFMTEGMPNGYSSRGGQVLNPYGPVMNVGGSSAGPGAAVASNFTAIAVGTETSGSILSPSNLNSIVGIKPTVGLISRSGIIPIAHSQDIAGPMARTVADAAILLGAMTGVDPADTSTWRSEGLFYTDYTPFLDPYGLNGARIGIPRFYYSQLAEDELEIMNRAIQVLKEQGAVIIDDVEIPSASEISHYSSSPVLTYEFKSDLNYYLGKTSSQVAVKSLADVIEFNLKHADEALKYGQTRLTSSEETSGTLTEPDYLLNRLRDLRLSQTEGIDAALKQHSLDSLLFPSVKGEGIAAKAGYPSIMVPGGYTLVGLPYGITFTGTAFSEPQLIKQAYAFEQATHYRVTPKWNN